VQLAGTAPTTPAPRRDEPIVASAAPAARVDGAAANGASKEPAVEPVRESSPHAAPSRDAERVASPKPAAAGAETKAPTPNETAAPIRSPSSAAPPPASVTKTKEPPRAIVPGGSRSGEAVASHPAPARNANSAMPFPAPSRVARNSAGPVATVPASAASSSRASASAARRVAATGARPANGSAIPWAVAGRAAPRVTLAKGSGERGALLPLSAPTGNSTQARVAENGPSAFVNVNAGAGASPGAPPGTVATTGTTAPPTALAVVARPALSSDAGPASAATAPAAVESAPIDYAARASDLMANHMPRLSQRAERQVARVLFIAGRSERVADDEVRAAAGAVGRDGIDVLGALSVSAAEAQRLGEAARAEYARRGGTPEALALQARAFGANPIDVEAAGNLAFLLLRQRPAQPEAARQLALYALSLHGTRYPEGRIEDWASFAIASALAGRERDARNAFLVTLALAPNLERHCKAALDVYAIYGERLRVPVEAMLQSANASGRANGSAFCEWPPHWVVSGAR